MRRTRINRATLQLQEPVLQFQMLQFAQPWNEVPQFTALCQCSFAACRDMVNLTADCVAQVQKVGLAYARSTLIKSLAAAEEPGEAHVLQAAVPEFGDYLGMQRDIGAALVSASVHLSHTLSDYGTRMAALLAERPQAARDAW